MSQSKRAFILTNGCPENRIDSARIQELFKQNNYLIAKSIRQADIIIFNTCAHTQDLEDASIEMIKQIESIKNPTARLIICGCLPKINKECLGIVSREVTFDSVELNKLNEISNLKIGPERINANSLVKITKSLNVYKWAIANLKGKGISASMLKLLETKYNQAISVCRPHTFYIKIGSGCLGNCAFCAIRLSRGRLESKPPKRIVEEFKDGLRKGYKDFALIGTELGAYGRDLGVSLVDLLEELVSLEGMYKIRLRNIHPKFLIEMMPELRMIFKSGKISFISCAVESGNNRILKLMNRDYTIEEFKRIIRILNKEFPDICIRTQVIVGFPTETEEEFNGTVSLLDQLSFDFVEVYMFQPRPGTKAAEMQGAIPKNIIKKRYFKLLVKAIFNESERKKRALKEYNALR